MDLVIQCVTSKYADFSGRARRSEYWFFVLAYFIASIIVSVVDALIGTMDVASGVGLLSIILALGLLIPSLAVSVRRLHDTDRSGWWVLIGFIPVIGTIWLLVLFCLKGTAGENRFGPDPLAAQELLPQS